MTEKLQSVYDVFIKQSNLNYEYTKIDMFKELREVLLGKAEAFEDAASLLAHRFPSIKTTVTNRFIDSREHHMSEDETEPKKVKA